MEHLSENIKVVVVEEYLHSTGLLERLRATLFSYNLSDILTRIHGKDLNVLAEIGYYLGNNSNNCSGGSNAYFHVEYIWAPNNTSFIQKVVKWSVWKKHRWLIR